MDKTAENWEAQGFTKNQIEQICQGVDAGVDVSLYAKNEFLAIQMQQIRLGLENGIDASRYAKVEYDWFQMEEIRKGLEQGLDVSYYESPDISYDRMQQLRLGLEDGINLADNKRLDAGILKQMRLAIKNHVHIVPYILAGYDAEQLEAIREALENGLDIEPWVKKEYRGIALQEIFLGLENNLDVSPYAKPELTWQQMRELRLGMEHMVDIEKYNSAFYSYRQMKEIREGLEEGLEVSYYCSPMYTASEMHKRRIRLEEDSAVWHKEIADTQLNDESEGTYSDFLQVTVTEDEMEAYLEVIGDASDMDKIAVVKALHDKGICYGVDYEMIDRVVKGDCPRKPILIASGQRRVHGKDGWYEYFFRTDFSGIPKELENGNLDYRDIEWFETVDKGQTLAVYHKSEKGEAGITITGKVLPAKHGREQGLLVGRGFNRLPDGKTYIASTHGIVTLNENRLTVSELLILNEVNLTNGNIDYDGNILIEGNVSGGAVIKASKDIIVKGFVEAAHITAGGSVILQKGMNGSGEGTIRAAKDVIGCFFEATDVYAGGNIQGDYFFKSILYANGIIHSVGKKGVIAGGVACAQKGIKAIGLGNPAGLLTHVMLGNIDKVKEKEEKLDETIKVVNQELFTLQNAHNEYQRKYAPEIRNAMKIYLKIESAIYTKEKQLEMLLREKKSMQEELNLSDSATAVVTGTLYEGVIVEIDGIRWQSKNLMGVTLRRVDNRIAVYANK
ncbi:MAG: DUF342 domain-containing protein [Wujia sp.]